MADGRCCFFLPSRLPLCRWLDAFLSALLLAAVCVSSVCVATRDTLELSSAADMMKMA